MYTLLTRIALVVSFASVANAATCDSVATDATCQAATPDGAAARDYARYLESAAGTTCPTDPGGACDLNAADDFNACCYIPTCTDAANSNDHAFECPAGAKALDANANELQDGTAAQCCEALTATDCAADEYFCAGFAGVDSATDPCATDCNACTGYLIEPAGFQEACEENLCQPLTENKAASLGVVIANLGTPTDETKVSDFTGKAVSAAAGWTHPGQADGAVPVAASCTGTNDGSGGSCELNAGETACAVEGGDCVFSRAASITCSSDDGTGEFTVVGAVGMTCVLPTQASQNPGTDITGMACSNMQTGSITCETLHTCDATTHHAGADGINILGADGLSGTDDDGVKCLAEGDPLTLVVANARPENAAGCNINMCVAAAVPNGYDIDGSAGTPGDAHTVPDLGTTTCEHDGTAGAAGAAATSTNWWSEGTCTGTISDAVEGKVAGAVEDCADWPRFAITGQAADCPDGCTFDQTAATVTCTQATGESDTLNAFVYTGCSQAKCNDLTGDDDQASTEFQAADCGKGMTIKADLAFPCTGSTCENWDCCTDDDGCAATAAGFDPADSADDNQGPCWGTNSACRDVPAPGVGNTCTCCDGTLHATLRDATEDQGGCGGNIGFFGADVTSADAATSADVLAVQGSCTACTPIANSAEADGTTDEAAKMVTCEAADNSRAVACVEGAITVDNSANGVSDVCRLECPFTEVVALIDRLHIYTDGCNAVSLEASWGTSTAAQQTTACENVEGCYYTPAGADPSTDPATCRPIYAGCNEIAAGSVSDCTAGPTLSGDDNTLGTADDVVACEFNEMGAGTADDVCQYTPPAEDYTSTITRCDALLATNWAHDLRDSCDATRACPLHGLITADPPGMIAMVKAVYTAAGVAPAGTDTWVPGAAPAVGGSGQTSLSLTDTNAAAYFLNDGDANVDTDWEVCMNIRDAVLAAPTCSAGSGR